MADLWSDRIGKIDIKTPVTVLREQAAILGERTKNIVEATILPVSTFNWAPPGSFVFAFNIVAPTLNGYQFRLFSISYPLEMYPVSINADDDIFTELIQADLNLTTTVGNLIVVTSEAEFLEALGYILKTDKTVNVVNYILAQASDL